MSPHNQVLPEPWKSFFDEVDALLTEETKVHCCGGFVVTQLYGVARTTSDIDFLSVVPNIRADLVAIAGKGTSLHQKYKVYLDAVTVMTPPEDYESRLIPMFPEYPWSHLKLFGLEAHDLALSKLERNWDRDRDDVQQLVQAGLVKADTLQQRYHDELRPNFTAHEERHDLTLKLWLASYGLMPYSDETE